MSGRIGNITTTVGGSNEIRGLDIDKNAVQRMEDGSRFVPDIELKAIAAFFGVSMDVLSIE